MSLRRVRPNRLRTAVLCAALLGASCDETRSRNPEQPSEPSPNASILPAPLSSELETKARHPPSDAGTPPDAAIDAAAPLTRWLKEDQSPEADVAPRESSGVRLIARLRWLDVPPFPRLPETNVEALARLRDALSLDLEIELSAVGRMRARLISDAFPLPRGSEFRSRLDRLGHLLFWDQGRKYTALPAGTLRAALAEQRPDMTPLVKPKLSSLGDGNAAGFMTEKIEIATPLGRLLLEEAAMTSSGQSGKLLCRLLAELVASDPSSAACDRPLVPVRAELFSRAGGHVIFEVQRIERDRPLETPLAPPAEARFFREDLPLPASWIVPPEERLRELRVRPVPRTEKPDPSAPKQGLIVQNRSDTLRYVLLDGLILAKVPARAELHVNALQPGKYAVVTLDFLGDDATPLRIVELPARVVVGDEAESAR